MDWDLSRRHGARCPDLSRWERRRTDPDYLVLRVGTADLPSAVELTDPEQDEHRRQVVWPVPDAPVTISLPEREVVGVAGPANTPRAVGRWLPDCKPAPGTPSIPAPAAVLADF